MEIKKSEFNEFKNTMTKLDSDTRVKFMDEIFKAKTSDEIAKQIGKLTDLINEKPKFEIPEVDISSGPNTEEIKKDEELTEEEKEEKLQEEEEETSGG